MTKSPTPPLQVKQAKPSRLTPLLPFLLGGVAIFILYFSYTVVLPFVFGDGTSTLSGVQKEAAQKSIDYSSRYLDNQTRFMYPYHVDEVRPTTPDEIEKYCKPFRGQVTDDLNDIRHYTITMTVRKIFSSSVKTIIVDGCTAFGSYMDAYKHR